MKIIYCCRSGNHASVIAGQIHLNQLPQDRLPSLPELINCSGFDCVPPPEPGKPCQLGYDQAQNEIYVMGLGADHTICLQAICHVLEQCADPGEWKFIHTSQGQSPFTRWGNFCSGKLRLKAVGRWLHALGIKRLYFQLVQRVHQVKEWNKVGKT